MTKHAIRRPGRARRKALTRYISAGLIGASLVVLVVNAVFASGFPVRHVELNDGGVWVTNGPAGLIGRLNRPAESLDAAFNPPAFGREVSAMSAGPTGIDVFQQGAAVAAWDRIAGLLYPVDVQRAVAFGDGVTVSGEDQVRLVGGTLAVLDPATGKIWASRVDTAAGISSLSGVDPASAPLATLGKPAAGTTAGAALTVGTDGTVYAVSAAGRVATIAPVGTGFGRPAYRQLSAHFQTPSATVVGDRLIVLDSASGTLTVVDGPTATLAVGATDGTGADNAPVLQQPGPDAAAVMVETGSALESVDLAGGKVTTMSSAKHGSPTEAVRFGGCVYAAWGGADGGSLRGCDGGAMTADALKGTELTSPVFRINRNSVVLNDLSNGNLWDLATMVKIANWTEAKPPPTPTSTKSPNPSTSQLPAPERKPEANPDTYGVRPGRTTLLHVLDNDSDPAGSILAITDITQPGGSRDSVAIAPDGQAVAITVPGIGPAVQFTYTVDDGKLTATATVTVNMRTPDQNGPPELRKPLPTQHTYSVPAGGHLEISALDDWRDPADGDPIELASAEVKGGSVTTTSDGLISYTAPGTGGTQTINYTVTDGRSDPVAGSVRVNVEGPTDLKTIAPITEPDAARGEVGQPITIRPLENDIPGADPLHLTAKLTLAADVPNPSGARVVTNHALGTVIVTAQHPGPYLLTYTAGFGDAPLATGQIRVDVLANPSSPRPPVAMPDSAILYGQAPTTVDVLANDFDPAGKMLVVQHAAVKGDGQPLQVAIVAGHWLRIKAPTAVTSTSPLVVDYTVTDGITGPVTGEVSVTQVADRASTVPVPVDDYATVRAGDQVTVPVLDNDTDPAGAPITLATNVRDLPAGEMQVTGPDGGTDPANGTAYVAGNQVRFVAPATLTVAREVTVAYIAQDSDLDQAAGTLHVTIIPPKSATNPNRPPAPLPVEARALAGETITIPVVTTGVDPDGDSVSVIGIDSAPVLGRVLSLNATSLSYQAYPTSTGTDLFTYQVEDRFGGVGTATIRIAVTPPGAPQPPVAVDDQVTAAPGAKVRVDVLANDLRAPDDAVTIQAITTTKGQAAIATLLSPSGPVEVTAPADGKTLTIPYSITDGTGGASLAILTVRGKNNADVPPTTRDAFPSVNPDGKTVTVAIGKYCDDPDGDPADLTITQIYGAPAATHTGATITIPVTTGPQTIAYQITDPGKATAVGLIHVPAVDAGAPYVKPGSLISIPRGGSTAVSLGAYIVDPAGRSVHLTTTQGVSAAPNAAVTPKITGTTTLSLSSRNYTGPAALTIEVSDSTSPDDPTANVAVLTIPVQVGVPTPVLFCPTGSIGVIEGGNPVTIDPTSRCHVWVADAATLPGLAYTATWATALDSVDIGGSGKHTITITAGGSAKAGAVGSVKLSVVGFPAVTATLPVTVQPAPPPTILPVDVPSVKAGTVQTVDVGQYMHSDLRDKVFRVFAYGEVSGPPAKITLAGSVVTIATTANTHGTISFAVTVGDVADQTRVDRQIEGRITMAVATHPDAPGTPAAGRTILSHEVDLSWAAPANNGSPIDYYEVDWTGSDPGRQICQASPCAIKHLVNAVPHSFTVRAHNGIDFGPPSQATTATPDAAPGPPTNLTVTNPEDRSVNLAWVGPKNYDGSAVKYYVIAWAGGTHQVNAPATAYTVTGLKNDVTYKFTIVAVNNLTHGPSAETDGQSAGAPARPGAPTFSVTNPVGSATRGVKVSWAAVDPNGWAPTTYTLTRSGGSGLKTICAATTDLSCDDNGIDNDGTMYSYTLTASNAAPGSQHTSPQGAAAQMEATATPDDMTITKLDPTGTDGEASITFDVPPSRGPSSTVTCTLSSGGSCGTWTYSTSGASDTKTITGFSNGQNTTVSLVECNGSHGGVGAGTPCDNPATKDVTTFGPFKSLSLNLTPSGNQMIVNFGVDPNGRSAHVVIQTSTQHQEFDTNAGNWNNTVVDTVGYDSPDNVTVTVTDNLGGRNPVSTSDSKRTPPNPTVTVSRGAKCGYGTEPACVGKGTCSTLTCGYIHVQTSGFSDNVTCTFDSDTGNASLVSQVYGPNQSSDSKNFYGWPGTNVYVTCGGVQGTFNWPKT